MRAEIDLPNPGGQLRPGMYAYGKVVVERPNVWTVPDSALTHSGGKSFLWRYENGRARRTEIETGIREGKWIEVTNRRIESESPAEEQWAPIDGSELVLTGEKLSTLAEGAPVRPANWPGPSEAESASTPSGAGETE
jgi:membrane fusion protein (multidrug efflux system)